MNDHMNQELSETNNSYSSPSTRSRTKCPGVSVIRREFEDLTGDHFSAVVLNQLLYWTQRVKDFDLLLEEERLFNPECNVQPRHGWIYKPAPELIEETMLKASPPTMRKYLRLLVEKGWVDERPHPQDGWNKTTQYRVNLRKLGTDLEAIGYRPPEVYRDVFIASLGEQGNGRDKEENKENKENKKSLEEKNFPSNQNKELCDFSSGESSFLSNEDNLASKEKDFSSNERNFPSKEKNLASYTYTEITSKNKSKEHTQRTRAREDESFFTQSLKIWNIHVGQDVHLSKDRKTKLKTLLEQHFDNDLVQWEQFCQRIKSSPFLMGEGPRKWRVTFDWILEKGNFLKILEGNFDDSDALQLKKAIDIQIHQDKEKNEVLSSIEDSLWRYWCRQASFGEEPLSLRELKKVAPASFGEFDGRLVWIESDSLKVLNTIEDLRLKFFSVIEKTYPQARNIRTRLKNTPQAVTDVSLPHPAIISQLNPLKQERKIYA